MEHTDLEYSIRPVEKHDLAELTLLCQEHAAFEKADMPNDFPIESLADLLFSSPPRIQCLVVEGNKGLAGYASFMRQFSTWDANFYMYLDCLFLRPSTRGSGIGRKLMEKVKEESIRQNCDGMQWQTPTFNQNAIEFYQHLGAQGKNKVRFFLDHPNSK